jgi:hypothetical protein
MKSFLILFVTVVVGSMACAAPSIGLGYKANDTVEAVLQRQVGHVVELRLSSGETIKGKVEQVSASTLHLTELVGQELFEAVVVLDDISAVMVRSASQK